MSTNYTPRDPYSHNSEPTLQLEDYGQTYPEPQQRASSATGYLVPIVLGLCALILIGFFAFMYLTRVVHNDPVAAEAPQQTPTTTVVTETTTETESVRETSTSSPSTSPSSAGGDFGAGLSVVNTCSLAGDAVYVATGTNTTTCAFAESVAEDLKGLSSTKYSTTTARGYSSAVARNDPSRNPWIAMQCKDNQDSNGNWYWVCRGGRGAVVYVYN